MSDPLAPAGSHSDPPEVLFIEDVAELIRSSPSTIRRRLRAGVFPVQPLPGIDKRLRWSRRSFDSWFRQGGVRR